MSLLVIGFEYCIATMRTGKWDRDQFASADLAITWRTSRRSRIEIACSAPVNQRTYIRSRERLPTPYALEWGRRQWTSRSLPSVFTRAKNEIAAVVCGRSGKYVCNWKYLACEIISRARRQKGWKMSIIARSPPLFTLTFLLYYFSCVSFIQHR